MKFANKRAYYFDLITTWTQREQNLSKTKLDFKLGINRVTLNKLIKDHKHINFTTFKRNYANHKIDKKIRSLVYKKTINFLKKLNEHRKTSVFLSNI